MNTRSSIFFALCLLLFFGCDKDPEPNELVLPSNLNVSLSVEAGLVVATATADKANFYTFAFFEDGETTEIESQDGTESYTYASSGTYEIRVRAHATPNDFIEVTESVSITVDPDTISGIPTAGYTTPTSYPGYTLVWADEFDGNALSGDWVHEIGNGDWGWGNNELQYYRQENVTVGGGYLQITAKEEPFNNFQYTSSRIKTQGRQSFLRGRIDIRAALPYGQGIWPALWMLGESFPTVGWPRCGEIDIMEMVGGSGTKDKTVHGTIHWDANGNHANYGGSNTLSGDVKFAEEFHVFSIIWDETAIRWLRDDIEYHVADISPADLSEFHSDFFFIFNVAVGGNWPGSPDASTVFPQTMTVDYVRVFQ